MAGRLPARLTKSEGRKFGLTVGLAFILVAAVMWWRQSATGTPVALVLGVALLAYGIVVPQYLGPVRRLWMRLGHLLSKVMNPLVMGVFYLLLFTPIGVVMRLFGRRPLVHVTSNNSYLQPRQPARGKAGLERQY
jgi:hypothetical protein